MGDDAGNPALLHEHDPAWGECAGRHLLDLRKALSDLPGADQGSYDHIGSTSVAGLAAKPFVDLQVRILPLPSHAQLVERLSPLGYQRAEGSRPDSPGVDRDQPRGEKNIAGEVWEKRLYVQRSEGVILHVRRTDSPWGLSTVWFRDWLRAHAGERARYEDVKRTLSAANAGKPDYDDYTRAKTAYFNDVQEAFTNWVAARPSWPEAGTRP